MQVPLFYGYYIIGDYFEQKQTQGKPDYIRNRRNNLRSH